MQIEEMIDTPPKLEILSLTIPYDNDYQNV